MPQPATLIPDCLSAGDLLVATGDCSFFNQLSRSLNRKAEAFYVAPAARLSAVLGRIDAIRRRDPNSAVLVHLPAGYPGFDPYLLAAGDAVIDADTPIHAHVLKLRNHDDEDRALRLHGHSAFLVEE